MLVERGVEDYVMVAKSSKLRIIAGAWRGRHITFQEQVGLRPTPNRIRETLFNWLQSHIIGANVLDLFSGSGVLGFEALSRGAATATLVESNPVNVQQLQQTKELLSAVGCRMIQADYLQFIDNFSASGQRPFDIIFLDPPFGQGLLVQAAQALTKCKLCAPGCWVYCEAGAVAEFAELPPEWINFRLKTAAKVHYGLWQVKQDAKN